MVVDLVQVQEVLTGVADSGVRAEAGDREGAKEVVREAEGDLVKVVVVDSGADLVADSAAVADLAASVAGSAVVEEAEPAVVKAVDSAASADSDTEVDLESSE